MFVFLFSVSTKPTDQAQQEVDPTDSCKEEITKLKQAQGDISSAESEVALHNVTRDKELDTAVLSKDEMDTSCIFSHACGDGNKETPVRIETLADKEVVESVQVNTTTEGAFKDKGELVDVNEELEKPEPSPLNENTSLSQDTDKPSGV